MKTYKQFITEAQMRIKVLNTAHYTSRENKDKIMQSGFIDSPSTGTYHPDDNKSTVYTTPSVRTGNDYGSSRVSLRIVNPVIQSTLSPDQYRTKVKEIVKDNKDNNDGIQQAARKISPIQNSRELISKGHGIVRVPKAHTNKSHNGSYIMVNKDIANKSINRNPSPTIRIKKR